MRQRLSEMLTSAATDVLEQRVKPVEALADDAEQVAAACHAMAIRFHRGGKLVCFGSGGPSTDAQHIAVEFVHPVIVGKRALPAISLTGDVATLTSIAGREGYAEVYAHQLRYLAVPEDIALGVSVDGNDPAVLAGLEEFREHLGGRLTIMLLERIGSGFEVHDMDEAVLLEASDLLRRRVEGGEREGWEPTPALAR